MIAVPPMAGVVWHTGACRGRRGAAAPASVPPNGRDSHLLPFPSFGGDTDPARPTDAARRWFGVDQGFPVPVTLLCEEVRDG